MSQGSPASLVSIITATYNWSSVLRYSIRTALWQTCHDFEMLIIGDGCTDDSEQVVASFGDPRLHWHNLPQNSGSQSAPNNVGLEMARGTYIAYLGHDDVWYPTHLAHLVKTLQETGADIAYSLAAALGPPGSGFERITGVSPFGEYERGLILPPSSVMHKRELTGDIGGWKDFRTISLPPDQELWVRAWDRGKRFARVDELTVFKFNSAWRKNSYIEKPSHEQEAYVRRIESEPDFLYRETLARLKGSILQCAHLIMQTPEEMYERPSGETVNEFRKNRGLSPLESPYFFRRMFRRGIRRIDRALGHHPRRILQRMFRMLDGVKVDSLRICR